MQQENREQITLRLKRFDRRLSGEPERLVILEKMLALFQNQVVAESERVNWMLCWSTFTLVPSSDSTNNNENYLDYAMIVVLLGRYKRKRQREGASDEPIPEKRTKWKAPQMLLCLEPLLNQCEREFPLPGEEYKHHFRESFVDRGNFKLTFTLKEFMFSARDISGGSFTWLRYDEAECWFMMTNGIIFIDDPTRFQSITIFLAGADSLEVDGKSHLTGSGRLDLSSFVTLGECILVCARTDLRVVFPTGKKSMLKIKSHASCKFDLDPCIMEYYSREWYPYPYRFFVSDVDHLLNLERMISGRSLKPISPNSAKKIAKGHGFHENMERLKSLRRMKVDQSLAHPVPFFSIGNKPLSLVKENHNTLILYEDNYSLARCTIRPEKRVILLDMIESMSSEFIEFEKIYRYPPFSSCLTMY